MSREQQIVLNQLILSINNDRKNILLKPKSKESLFRCIYIDLQTSRVISIGHKESCVFYRESYLYEDVDSVVAEYREYISSKEQAVIEELIKLVNQTND